MLPAAKGDLLEFPHPFPRPVFVSTLLHVRTCSVSNRCHFCVCVCVCVLALFIYIRVRVVSVAGSYDLFSASNGTSKEDFSEFDSLRSSASVPTGTHPVCLSVRPSVSPALTQSTSHSCVVLSSVSVCVWGGAGVCVHVLQTQNHEK